MKWLLTILILVGVGIPSVMADTTITFNELGLVSQNFDFYHPNGTFFKEILSNESITLENNSSYQVIVRPTRVNYLKNPAQFLNYINENTELILTLFFILVVVVVVVKK